MKMTALLLAAGCVLCFGANANADVVGLITESNAPGSITVAISIGSDDGVKAGDTLKVYRNKRLVGKIQVSAISPDRSRARIVAIVPMQKIKKGDRVVRK